MASCPFCAAEIRTGAELCQSCGRNPRSSRRVCTRTSCGRITPSHAEECIHCGDRQKSDLRWKIPLIILLFLIAIAVTTFVELLSQ